MLRSVTIGLLAISVLLVERSQGDEESPGTHIGRWLRQLQSEDFGERRLAREQILVAGQPAILELRQAAADNDHVLAAECVTLLAQLAHHTDPLVCERAEHALQDLAASADSSSARLAQTLIAPSAPISDWPSRSGMPAQVQLRMQFGNRVAPPLNPGGNQQFRQVQMRLSNGQREIEVVENHRRVTLSDTNGQQIKAVVTETIEGREVTREVVARDLTELRTRAPDMAELFERYAAQLQVQVRPANGG